MGWFAKIDNDADSESTMTIVSNFVIEDEGEYITIVHKNNTGPIIDVEAEEVSKENGSTDDSK
tara:strand:- start:193 stop:381 length:189 start_codon:yes stop_codon:yes gene_type:complete